RNRAFEGCESPEDPAAWPRPRLHRRAIACTRPLDRDGRRRLHLRLPPTGAVRREVPTRTRVRDGIALPRLDRARFDAGLASVPGDAGDDVDPQPPLLEQVL